MLPEDVRILLSFFLTSSLELNNAKVYEPWYEPASEPVTRLGQPRRLPGSLPVAYPVIQVGNWSTGSDDVGLIQSTKAPKAPDYACL